MNSTAGRNLLFWLLFMVLVMVDSRYRDGYLLFYPDTKRNDDPAIYPQQRQIKNDDSNDEWIYNMIRSY